ncbi:Hypothetical predicted protein [Mytilus galloprovincialis]|uniref:Uncharacterized protein n=1 Tax=Mytilus galloprovincialis TaxID=29158 RepID=A0A8B6D9S9_MYTGA|nr:Hypothetical predicted protein [Mytilus galloprovincialis]
MRYLNRFQYLLLSIPIGMVLLPVLSVVYIVAPWSKVTVLLNTPSTRFLSYTCSYLSFLFLTVVAKLHYSDMWISLACDNTPTSNYILITLIFVWILGWIWEEMKQVWSSGIEDYAGSVWNIIDSFMLMFLLASFTLDIVVPIKVADAFTTNPLPLNVTGEQVNLSTLLHCYVTAEVDEVDVCPSVSYSVGDTGLWGVVNNAGITGNLGPVEWLTRKDYQAAFEINTLGMVETTRIFLPLIIKEKGRIVNITSMMGRIAAANPTYIVSKFAAEGYSDVLRRELYKRGVTVHILEPGFFRTNLINIESLCSAADNSFRGISSKLKQYYGQVYVEEWKDIITKTITNLGSPHTHLVVNAYVHALTSKYPKYRYLVGNDAKYIYRILWNLPEWISDYLLTRTAILPQAERNS